MTAEEKLKELYEDVEFLQNNYATPYSVRISPKDIDLIANLVVERLANGVIRDACYEAIRRAEKPILKNYIRGGNPPA